MNKELNMDELMMVAGGAGSFTDEIRVYESAEPGDFAEEVKVGIRVKIPRGGKLGVRV